MIAALPSPLPCSGGSSGAAAGAHPAVGRLRPRLGLLLNAILLIGPQLDLHPHLGSWWLNSVIAAGAGSTLLIWQVAARRRDAGPGMPRQRRTHPRPAGGLLLLWRLATFPRWSDEMKRAPRCERRASHAVGA